MSGTSQSGQSRSSRGCALRAFDVPNAPEVAANHDAYEFGYWFRSRQIDRRMKAPRLPGQPEVTRVRWDAVRQIPD
jgi:hypothetical protein